MIRMNRKTVMTISVFLAATLSIWMVLLPETGSAMSTSKTRDVKVWRAERQEITSAVSAPGIVEAVGKRDVFPLQPLKVRNLYIKRGDKVKAGDRLLEYDVDQLESQYVQLVSNRIIQFEILGKLRAADGTKSTAALESGLEQAAEAVNSAWNEYYRLREKLNPLLSLKSSSKAVENQFEAAMEALRQAKSAVQKCETAYEAAAANLNEVEKYNDQLEKNKAADIKIQEENIRNLDLRIAEAKKTIDDILKSELSPMSGTVADVNAAEGAPAGIQYPAFSIVDTGRLEIRVNIKEFDAALVKPGQKAAITGDSLNGAELGGTVAEVAPVASRNKSLTGEETVVEAVVGIDGPPGRLLPGMNVTCRIVAAEKDDAIVVSYVAIKDVKDGSKSVFLVNGRGMIQERPVSLGISSDTNVEVVDGLEPGDLVVTNWEPSFKTGDRARIMD